MVKGRSFIFRTPNPLVADQLAYANDRSGPRSVYLMQSTSPRSATFVYTVATSTIQSGISTYIILVGAAAGTFAPGMIFNLNNGSWAQAEVIGSGQYALLPVNISAAGSYTVYLDDGVNTGNFSITATTVTDIVGTYARTSYTNNTLYPGLSRSLMVIGTGTKNVATVNLNGTSVTFTAVRDNYLIINLTGVVAGVNTIQLYDTSNTLLDTISIAVGGNTCQIDLSGYYYTSNFITTVHFSGSVEDLDSIIIDDGVNYVASDVQTYNQLQSKQVSSEAFTMIVRNKEGQIVPLTAYTITGDNYVSNGMADYNGKISVALTDLPDYFTITFASYELQYLNSSYSKASL